MTKNEPLEIGGISVAPGRRESVEIPIARLVTGTPVALPVVALNGVEAGPSVWINAAIHGDEINGVEIIRRVLDQVDPKRLRGRLLAVPIVNVHGFLAGSRYLPDRRDLNRSFPGSVRGSLARRVAHLLMTEVVERCTYGIDLHTGSDHRTNLPQIRANLDDPETTAMAEAFAAPVMMHSSIRDGSLRQAASEAGARVLLFEGGEAWRFNADAIEVGTAGVLRVLAHVGCLDPASTQHPLRSKRSIGSKWVRAGRSGILNLHISTGDQVEKGQVVGVVYDALGARLAAPKASETGLVVGVTLDPLVNRGDAIVHIAQLDGANQ